jgi:hypothetical protein
VSETDLYSGIIGAWSNGPVRIFRNQVGLAWQGTVIERTPTRLILGYPRAIRSGMVGMSDLIGWSPSGSLAIYTAIECKAQRGRLTDEQSAFLNLVQRAGGRSGVARNIEDAGRIIRGEMV